MGGKPVSPSKRPSRARRLLILPPIVIGVALVVYLARSRSGPEETDAAERRTAVRVVQARDTTVVPRVIGYGTVEPERVWLAVAQVSGRVVEKSPRAQRGATADAGTVLLKIDPRGYELAIRETEAQIAKLQADLLELETREANARRTLEIQKRSLDSFERELDRKKELRKDNVVAQSDVDQEESRYLQQLVLVQDLENTLSLVPAERTALEANVSANRAKLEAAQLDLSYTTIEAPFPCRLVEVDFEETEYVVQGQVLIEAHDIAVAEISAQVPINRLRHLIPSMPTGPAILEEFLSGDIIQQLGLTAVVRLKSKGFLATWDARVARIRATIDPETRTLGVIVAVDGPYEQAIPGSRPPLVRDMFCEVELRGRPKPDLCVLPRSAVHGGEVYVAREDRLERRPVEIAFSMHDFVCLNGGVVDGELVIVSDPIPAIEGMLLHAVVDAELEERIEAVARGEADIR